MQEPYIFEPFTKLLLEKIGIFFEQDEDERMQPRRRVLVCLHGTGEHGRNGMVESVRTSIVMMKPINASLTRRYPSGSVSALNAPSKAKHSLPNNESQSSSSSCSERKLPVVLRT